MQTPTKCTLEDFARERDAWIKANCVTDGDFQLCAKCKTNVEIVGVYFSFHDARFGDLCAGAGRVVRLVVPYCPACESTPEDRGCFHEYPMNPDAAASALFN